MTHNGKLVLLMGIVSAMGCGGRVGDDTDVATTDDSFRASPVADGNSGGATRQAHHSRRHRPRHWLSGATEPFGGGLASTWAGLGRRGEVATVGVTLSAPALEQIATAEAVTVPFPRRVAKTTFIDHLGLDFNPNGHPPAPYLVPHFDAHFYGLSQQEVDAIDCVDEPMPTAEALPSPYIIPGTGPEPDGTCVPMMGVHAIDPTSPELNGSPFAETLILGYHAGTLAFIEPMIAQDYFASHVSYTRAIAQPASIGRSTRFPTRLTVTYHGRTRTYTLVLSDFVDAS